MTARIALLMVAVVGLAACESTKAVDTSPAKPVAVETQVQDTAPRIVRSPVVADDEDVAAVSTPKKRVHTASLGSSPSASSSTTEAVDTEEPAAPVSKPDKPAKPGKTDTANKPDKTDAPVTTADASAPPPATPSDSGPAPTDTAPDTSATPTTDASPAADGTTPKSMFSDPSTFMQAQLGGFPVWLIALVGVVLLAALLIGLGGRKKPEEVV